MPVFKLPRNDRTVYVQVIPPLYAFGLKIICPAQYRFLLANNTPQTCALGGLAVVVVDGRLTGTVCLYTPIQLIIEKYNL